MNDDEVNNIVTAINDLVSYRGRLVAEFVEKLEEVDVQLNGAREAFAKLGVLPSVKEILRLDPVKRRRSDYGVRRGRRPRKSEDELQGNPDSNSAP